MEKYRAPAKTRTFPLEWFAGDIHAHSAAMLFAQISQLWDDLLDGDTLIEETRIHDAFLSALVYLPLNPFYAKVQRDVIPMLIPLVAAYEAANQFERLRDPEGLEIGHTLRFMAGNVVIYFIHMCLGPERAREVVPDAWKLMVNERIDDYLKEHSDDAEV